MAVTNAHCPNSCSGRGDCGEFDMCSCFTDYTGSDCGQRTCPFEKAWVVTNANGDINHDDDRWDGVTYLPGFEFKESGMPYVVDQNNPTGTFESWPHTLNTVTKDEGHFYMECANRGRCDRGSGECQCFSGFTGAACERSTCPGDCSGHGLCKTVSLQNGGNAYTLWDGEMSRSCVCDPGFDGVDCSQRKCPFGDDPLTTSQTTETAVVDIWADDGRTSGLELVANDAARILEGSFKLKYTDYNGKVWTTDSITIAADESTGTHFTTIANNAKAALLALPNDVIRDVTVTASYIESVAPGVYTITSTNMAIAAGTNGDSAHYASGYLRCFTGNSGDEYKVAKVDGTSGKVYQATAGDWATDDVAIGAGLTSVCMKVEQPWGFRLTIKFTDTPGDLTSLTAVIDDVKTDGKTNAQTGKDIIQTDSIENPEVGIKGSTGILMHYYPTGDFTGAAMTTMVVIFADTTPFYAEQKVKCSCTVSGTTLSRGIFTVASVSADASVTLTEVTADCTGTTTLSPVSPVIVSNTDLSRIVSAGQALILEDDTNSPATTTTIAGFGTYNTGTGLGIITLTSNYGGDADDTDNMYVKLATDGTSEGSVCSSRGLCDSETGLCSCFRGYTGFACNLQNALSN